MRVRATWEVGGVDIERDTRFDDLRRAVRPVPRGDEHAVDDDVDGYNHILVHARAFGGSGGT